MSNPATPEPTDRSLDQSDATRSDAPETGGPSKAADIRSVEDLLVFAYRQRGKRFTIPARVFEELSAQPVSPGQDEQLADPLQPAGPLQRIALDLSRADPLLAVPPRLLVAIEDGPVDAPLRKRLLAIVGAVLRRHISFRSDEVQASLRSTPVDRQHTFEGLRSAIARGTAQQLGFEAKELTAADQEKLTANAVTSLALYLSLRDRWTIEDLTACLHQNLWQTARAKSPRRRPKALVADSRTPDALGVVADIFDARVRRANALAAEEERIAEQARNRAHDAEVASEAKDELLDRRADEIAQLNREISELRASIEDERKGRVVDTSHHVQDFEKLRTRIARMLGKQTELLSDGLHALQNGSTTVTEEYLDRAIEAFTKELQQLENGVGS